MLGKAPGDIALTLTEAAPQGSAQPLASRLDHHRNHHKDHRDDNCGSGKGDCGGLSFMAPGRSFDAQPMTVTSLGETANRPKGSPI